MILKDKFDKLEVLSVSKSYGEKQVLNKVSLKVRSGEIIGLLGPNGAGKSTIMKVISGLAKINGGNILLDGVSVNEDRCKTNRRIGMIPQENNLERELTVKQAIYCYALLFGVKEFEVKLARVGRSINLEEIWQKNVRQLSGGYARRVLIARALITDPDLLLLDEPSAGLDPDARRQLWDIIKSIAAEGRGILITTHYMEEAAQLCDKIYFLHHGEIAWAGTPRQLREQNTTLESMFINIVRKEQVI